MPLLHTRSEGASKRKAAHAEARVWLQAVAGVAAGVDRLLWFSLANLLRGLQAAKIPLYDFHRLCSFHRFFLSTVYILSTDDGGCSWGLHCELTSFTCLVNSQRLCPLDCQTTKLCSIPPLILSSSRPSCNARLTRGMAARLLACLVLTLLSRSSVPFAHRLLFWAARPPWSRARAVRAAHLHGPSDNSPTLRLRCGVYSVVACGQSAVWAVPQLVTMAGLPRRHFDHAAVQCHSLSPSFHL